MASEARSWIVFGQNQLAQRFADSLATIPTPILIARFAGLPGARLRRYRGSVGTVDQRVTIRAQTLAGLSSRDDALRIAGVSGLLKK